MITLSILYLTKFQKIKQVKKFKFTKYYMASFYQLWNQLQEAPLAPPGGAGAAPPPGGDLGGMGGDPMGGAPPMGGGMGAPPPGGGMGGDPMGGGAPGQGEPVPVKVISTADAWKVLEKIVSDKKHDKFFEEINIQNK